MQQSPINLERVHSQIRVFVDLDLKRMFMISHKCGVAIYEHLLSMTYFGKMNFLQPITEIQKVGNWLVLIEFDEVDEFLKQYNETEFSKIMITRDPYERMLSFYTNSFWDHATQLHEMKDKIAHYETYQLIYGDRYDEVVEQAKTNDFQKGFNIFMDSTFVNPTPGALEERQSNNGYGNIHFIPQSSKYRRGDKIVLTDIQFIDIRDGIPHGPSTQTILDFLGVEDMMIKRPINISSNTQKNRNKAWQYFSHEALKIVNEMYHYDFTDFGYSKH